MRRTDCPCDSIGPEWAIARDFWKAGQEKTENLAGRDGFSDSMQRGLLSRYPTIAIAVHCRLLCVPQRVPYGLQQLRNSLQPRGQFARFG